MSKKRRNHSAEFKAKVALASKGFGRLTPDRVYYDKAQLKAA